MRNLSFKFLLEDSIISLTLCLSLFPFSQVSSLQLSIPSITTRGFAHRTAPAAFFAFWRRETSDAESAGTRDARSVCRSHFDRAGDATPLSLREQREDEWPASRPVATCRAKGVCFHHLMTKVRLSLVFSYKIQWNKKVIHAPYLGFVDRTQPDLIEIAVPVFFFLCPAFGGMGVSFCAHGVFMSA